MSTRSEQFKSLLLIRDLLEKRLLLTEDKELRSEIYRCLRHFPPLKETGEPMFGKYYY